MAPENELKRGSAELMILASIEERARHGYEIAKLIDDRSTGVLRFHVASLYPMLYRMERRGWDELALHLAELYREARASGLDHTAALAQATAALPKDGPGFARELESASLALPDIIVERWREHEATELRPGTPWPARLVADLKRDVRGALRMLARTPAFTFVLCLTLALGIGANAVIFTAVDALLLQRAPVADPETLVSVYTGASSGRDPFSSSSYPDFTDIRASGAFADLAAFTSIELVLDSAGSTEPVVGELVSGNYFDLLGVTLPMGRGFRADEDAAGAPARVVVISNTAWMNRFGGDPAIVGRTASLNGQTFTIIGVTPRGFTGPVLGRVPEMWAPMALQPELRPPSAGVRRTLGGSNLLASRGTRWLNMIGRLAEPSALQRATASLDSLAASFEQQYPQSNRGRRYTVVPFGEGPGVRTSTRPLLRLLSVAVVLVLLIACANVAGLLTVRAVSRRREVAVRIAVGAGRSRLVRQWLTESVVLALLGSLGGLLLAWWGAPLLYQIGLPPTVAVAVNGRVFAFTLVVAVGSGILFGLAPILQTFRRDTIAALRDQGGAVAGSSSASKWRGGFVVVQVALSLLLLIGAGLFLRTLRNATAVDLGYDVDRVLLADLNMDVRGYAPEAGQVAYGAILERLNALPGVVEAGAARVTVLSGAARTMSVSTDNLPVAPDNRNALNVRANVITDGYLRAMGISIRQGRNFTASDRPGAPRVAIVSQALATRLHPGIDPLGRTVMLGDDPLQIVGVVPDTIYRSTTEQSPPPFLYLPVAQNYESGMTLHIRTAGEPLGELAAVRRVLREVDRQLVLGRPRTLRDEFNVSVADQRLMATLIGLFGVVALILAAIGLYGVMAHLASQRTTEIGVRMALGAEPSAILGLLLKDGLRLVAIGCVLGIAGALAAARFVRAQLFGVDPLDPLTFAIVGATLLLVGAAACLLPAWRAMRIDPIVALRTT